MNSPSPPSGFGCFSTFAPGFADSPVALLRHPLRGLGARPFRRCRPRVRGLTRGFIPSPPSGVYIISQPSHFTARSFGNANNTIVAEPGGTAQNALAAPVATAMYCFPFIAYVTTPPFIRPPVLNR
jgi:hypothetical protein